MSPPFRAIVEISICTFELFLNEMKCKGFRQCQLLRYTVYFNSSYTTQGCTACAVIVLFTVVVEVNEYGYVVFHRVPEIIHQPCILGLEQAGLAETIEYVLKKFPSDVQDQLVQVEISTKYTLFTYNKSCMRFP